MMKIKKSKIIIITMLLLCFALSIMPMKVLASTEMSNANIGSVKFDYMAGEAPKASANITYDEEGNYNNYEIEYEYWEEMKTNENGDAVPVKYWYSDESKNNALASDKKITTFEEGKTYMYSISLKAKDGYIFSDNCAVKINNETVKKQNVTKVNNATGLFVTAIKTIKPISKKTVELIEITDVTTKFNVGDAPKFTGKVSKNSLYEIDYEGWAGDNEIITTSEYWNNRFKDWGNAPLTSFKANTKYSYTIYVKLTDEAVKNGYYFDRDKTKLSINGEFINIDSKYVGIDEGNPTVATFGEILKITPTENSQENPTTPSEPEKPSQEPVTPTTPTQETEKEPQATENKTEQTKNETNNPKTGDNITTSIMLFVASIATIGTLTIVKRKKSRE